MEQNIREGDQVLIHIKDWTDLNDKVGEIHKLGAATRHQVFVEGRFYWIEENELSLAPDGVAKLFEDLQRKGEEYLEEVGSLKEEISSLQQKILDRKTEAEALTQSRRLVAQVVVENNR